MTPLTYKDLHKFTRVRITHLCHTWDHSQVRALLGEELQDNRHKWMAPNHSGCSWADRRPPHELVKTERFIQVDRLLEQMKQKGTPPWSPQKGFITLVVLTSSCEHQCPIWLKLRTMHLCTYPKWAIGHIGSSPDNRNCMFDWFNWHIGAGKHTIRLALYLDINRVSFSILKSSNTSRRFRYFKNLCIVWTAQDCSKMCQVFFFQNCSSEILKKHAIYNPASLPHLTLAHSYTILQHIENSQAQRHFSASKWQLKEITSCFASK